MSQQTNISIRIDDELKKKFDKLCDELGLTMSTAINLFVKTVVREQRIPFDLSLRTFNAETLKVFEDVENHKNLSGPYKNVNDLMASLNEDD